MRSGNIGMTTYRDKRDFQEANLKKVAKLTSSKFNGPIQYDIDMKTVQTEKNNNNQVEECKTKNSPGSCTVICSKFVLMQTFVCVPLTLVVTFTVHFIISASYKNNETNMLSMNEAYVWLVICITPIITAISAPFFIPLMWIEAYDKGWICVVPTYTILERFKCLRVSIIRHFIIGLILSIIFIPAGLLLRSLLDSHIEPAIFSITFAVYTSLIVLFVIPTAILFWSCEITHQKIMHCMNVYGENILKKSIYRIPKLFLV